jgi:uncharacterized protein YndB with AHSA1/START domain
VIGNAVPDASLDTSTLRLTHLTRCEVNVRPDGAWRVGGRNESGEVLASSGKCKNIEVMRPEHMVFAWTHHGANNFTKPRGHETTVRIELRAVGQRTALILIHSAIVNGYMENKSGRDGFFDKTCYVPGGTHDYS